MSGLLTSAHAPSLLPAATPRVRARRECRHQQCGTASLPRARRVTLTRSPNSTRFPNSNPAPGFTRVASPKLTRVPNTHSSDFTSRI